MATEISIHQIRKVRAEFQRGAWTQFVGYLRETNPTGDKINITNGAIATYDFSGDLRKFQWGVQAGVDWKAFKHLKVHADLNWGLNDIFNKDFKTVTFDMYAIYLNVGFGYAF
jgi:hypothetical protein